MSDRCTTVGKIGPMQILLWIVGGVMILLGVVLIIAGIAGVADGQFPAAALIVVGLVAGLFGRNMVRKTLKDVRTGLTVVVCPDAITFKRQGEVVDTVGRAEVGLVVLNELGRAGITDLEVYSPDRQRVGEWETNEIKNALGYIRALRHHDYPWVVNEKQAGATLRTKVRSKLAPAWADEVLKT